MDFVTLSTELSLLQLGNGILKLLHWCWLMAVCSSTWNTSITESKNSMNCSPLALMLYAYSSTWGILSTLDLLAIYIAGVCISARACIGACVIYRSFAFLFLWANWMYFLCWVNISDMCTILYYIIAKEVRSWLLQVVVINHVMLI